MASPTASDVLVETLIDWGVDTIFGIPGDGINGVIESLRTRQDRDQVHPGPARGGRRLHCLRLREVHRQARRLPCDLGSRRHPSPQRPLRRQARRPAGPRHHRAAIPRPARTRTPSRTSNSTNCSWMSASTTARIMGPQHVENVVELACRTALAYRGVAHVTIPVDIQSQPVERHRSRAQRPAPRLGRHGAHARQLPSEDQLAPRRRRS